MILDKTHPQPMNVRFKVEKTEFGIRITPEKESWKRDLYNYSVLKPSEASVLELPDGEFKLDTWIGGKNFRFKIMANDSEDFENVIFSLKSYESIANQLKAFRY